MTTLDTPLTAAAADGILAHLAGLGRFAYRLLTAIGGEIAYMVAEDRAHGRIASHRDAD